MINLKHIQIHSIRDFSERNLEAPEQGKYYIRLEKDSNQCKLWFKCYKKGWTKKKGKKDNVYDIFSDSLFSNYNTNHNIHNIANKNSNLIQLYIKADKELMKNNFYIIEDENNNEILLIAFDDDTNRKKAIKPYFSNIENVIIEHDGKSYLFKKKKTSNNDYIQLEGYNKKKILISKYLEFNRFSSYDDFKNSYDKKMNDQDNIYPNAIEKLEQKEKYLKMKKDVLIYIDNLDTDKDNDLENLKKIYNMCNLSK